jgi:SAM-dependent methyltransferase
MRKRLKNSFLWNWIKPGFPDAARLIAQTPSLRRALGAREFRGRCLNAGCGEGLYWPFLESFPGVTLIDDIDISVSPDRWVHGRKTEHRMSQGSLTELPYENASFDGCLCTEVIEHIQDHGKAVAELSRVLRPGALLLTSVPQTPAPWDPNHARQGYTLAEFTHLLEGAGFEVLAHESCFFVLMRGIMIYWRRPLLRFGNDRTPYIPNAVLSVLVHADRILKLGKPWDLVVCAVKRK